VHHLGGYRGGSQSLPRQQPGDRDRRLGNSFFSSGVDRASPTGVMVVCAGTTLLSALCLCMVSQRTAGMRQYGDVAGVVLGAVAGPLTNTVGVPPTSGLAPRRGRRQGGVCDGRGGEGKEGVVAALWKANCTEPQLLYRLLGCFSRGCCRVHSSCSTMFSSLSGRRFFLYGVSPHVYVCISYSVRCLPRPQGVSGDCQHSIGLTNYTLATNYCTHGTSWSHDDAIDGSIAGQMWSLLNPS
jgi:hypothetical protein